MLFDLADIRFYSMQLLDVSINPKSSLFAFLHKMDTVLSQIMDLLGSEMQQRFNIGDEVIVNNYGFVMSCSVLPSLHEGYIIGKISSPSLLLHK